MHTTKRSITWILVADGARARLLVSDGPGGTLAVGEELDFIGTRLASRDIGSDRPGRASDGTGSGRHAIEPPTDPRRHNAVAFARSLVEMLEEGLGRGAYERLVLVAPPRALGDLRTLLPDAVRERVIAELNNDLTGASLADVSDHLRAILSV
ncbi:MAG: host attachment protein [Alphaproteobacteria bacterium]